MKTIESVYFLMEQWLKLPKMLLQMFAFGAELWGILDGILILLHKGYKKVRIQTDNFEVVRALSMEESVDSGITLLRRFKQFLRSKGQWEIKYVPRKCNLIADQLAKISLFW
ncbi:hypothetical protein Goklo_007465 [Gossypium klotzschianum]|uniref:RNase H type-1 domain-containing protein n=3 Tax=Gossypium klotzschianum TaxID=34286 RepID=A0A7J8W2H0_9ROSI|nr:hypothetical protein [Gossypium klotzschianum]